MTLLYVLMPMSWYLFWFPLGDKTYYGFLVSSGCLLSRKVWWVVRIGSFFPKLRYFTRMDQRRDHVKVNFDYFQIQKWMLQTVRAEKVEEKNGVICLVFMFPSWAMVCKLSKKCIFYNFVLTSARNLSLLKQCTYVHLKVLLPLFQKIVWFIGVQANVHEILAIKISKNMLTQQKFNKILRL